MKSKFSVFSIQFSAIPHSPFALLAPARLALRAACGRLPGQLPLARVQAGGDAPGVFFLNTEH